MESSSEEPKQNRAEWYREQTNTNSVRSNPSDPGPFACPCCHCFTLSTRGQCEICEVCYWEDDGQDDHDADVVRGGPNGDLSLTKARSNYKSFGACEENMLENVRKPTAEELPQGE